MLSDGLRSCAPPVVRHFVSEDEMALVLPCRRGWSGPLTEALLSFYQDFENIKQGAYGLPYDMVTLSHRQNNPLFILSQASAFIREATATLRRRYEHAWVPPSVWT